MKFCAAILILKVEENTRFRHVMLYYFKKGKNATETQKKICAVYGEGAVTERVKSGLRSFLVLLTFWPNNSLLWGWGYLMHWKMFSSTPGLYSLEANSGSCQHTQDIQTNKVIGESKKMCLLALAGVA